MWCCKSIHRANHLHMIGPPGRVSHFLSLKSLLKKSIKNCWHTRFWLKRKRKNKKANGQMVGGKSFPCHPMWFQCFLFKWCKFPMYFCPWTCLTGELIAFRGCRKEKRSQRDWNSNVWQKRFRPRGLQMNLQGERKQGFERRLKKRSLRKQ